MGQQGGLAQMMLPLAMFAAIFYFLIIRPQKKKQRQHEDMLASISKGSEIITAGGFFGVVREILDDSYIIEMDENVKVRILKSSISVKKSEGDKGGTVKKEKKKKKKPRYSDAEPQVGGVAEIAPEALGPQVDEATKTAVEVAGADTVAVETAESQPPEENNEEKA